MAGMHPLAQKIRVFCFFSSEKKTLALPSFQASRLHDP
jgi:hypothetical protein